MTEISALKTLLLPETTATDSMTEEDKQKMQRNYQKFQLEIQGRILQDLTEDIRDFKDTLKKDYYKEKVVKYENEDDEHRWRTAVVRQCLSSPLDRLKQNAIDWATFVSDVANGAKMAVLDLIEGLASLVVIVYYGWRASVAMLVEATASNPPDWVDDALKDYDKHVYPLTTILTDPVAVVESLAQTASDTFEKEGGTYAASYLITDFIVGKLLSDITKIDGPSTKGAKTTGLAQYGDDFGKMGTYVENPNIKVDWSQYAEHGFERMQQRGMTQEMVDQIVANGKVLSQNNGSKFAFITQEGVAVVSKDGKLITTWSSEYYDNAMQEIIIKLFGE